MKARAQTVIAKGSASNNGQGKRFDKSPRVAVSFERAMFERISGEAARRRIPFAAVVRERLLKAYQ